MSNRLVPIECCAHKINDSELFRLVILLHYGILVSQPPIRKIFHFSSGQRYDIQPARPDFFEQKKKVPVERRARMRFAEVTVDDSFS